MHSNAKMKNKGIKKRETLHRNISLFKSGRQDSNLRPPGPKPGALPDCATPRLLNPPIVSNIRNQRLQSERSRGDRIRTCDHLVPNQARYRTALHPVLKLRVQRYNYFFTYAKFQASFLYFPPTTTDFSLWHDICYLDFIVTSKKITSILKL